MTSTTVVRRLALVPALVAFAFSSVPAYAQGGSAGSDKVAAQALFEDGRRLMQGGKYADACPKFVESQRLDPSASTLLNLASCWEKAGRAATAWATYREAESAADAIGRKDYVDAAERHARALAPTLAHLTLAVAQPVDGMQVRRDGVPVGAAEWGLAVPVDQGSHAVEASAPGYKAWSATVDVPRDGAQATATVPPLEALPVAAPASTPSVPVPSPAQSEAATSEVPSKGGAQRTIGLVVGGAGIVGLAVSGVFTIIATGKNQDSKAGCPGDVCSTQAAFDDRNSARSAGDVATVALFAGAGAVIVGGLLWWTAPKATAVGRNPSPRVVFAPVPGGAVLAGAW